MTKKRRKIGIIEVLGIILILVGLGIVANELGTRYFERKSQSQELINFMNAPVLADGTVPTESMEANVWGSIEIDKIGVNHLIAKSSNWDLLNRYVVAWESSPNPPEKGNFAIAGHNGNCAACVFRDFDKLEKGDTVKLNDRDNTYVYEISSIFIVPYTDISVLNDTPDEATITLVTCTQQVTYDTQRTIVKGSLKEVIPNT